MRREKEKMSRLWEEPRTRSSELKMKMNLGPEKVSRSLANSLHPLVARRTYYKPRAEDSAPQSRMQGSWAVETLLEPSVF